MKLDEVVRELEQNANIGRIKKLIYFTCYGTWESDSQVIDSVGMRELVESLLSLNLSITELRIVLNNIVQKLNKSAEYSRVAKAILSQVVKLYPDEEDSTHPILMEDADDDATKPESPAEIEQLFAGQSKAADRQALPESHEWFDARMKLVQQTTPLRAKILMFSSLYHEFTFGERDWTLLKKKGLSDLLRKLSRACQSIEELEKKLESAAKKLPGSSEYLQAAKAIAKYLTPYYEEGEPEENLEEVPREVSEEEVPESGDLYELAIGNDTQSSQASPVHPGDANNNDNSSSSWSVPTIPVPQLANENDSADPDAGLKVRSRAAAAEDSTELDGASTTKSNALSGSGSARKLKITDVLKQKRELEADIQALVDKSVDPVMTIIENTLTDLEKVLDDRLQGEEICDRLSRKYKALKDWVAIAGDALAKYMEVLNQMEQSDIEDLSKEPKTEAEPPSPETNRDSEPEEKADTKPADTERQQKIMELAKQGNPKAIAALLNQSLKSRSITASVLLKEECLHIILESDQEPNRQKTAKFASKTLRELNLTSIEAAKVHWRKAGKKSPDWSQELELSPVK